MTDFSANEHYGKDVIYKKGKTSLECVLLGSSNMPGLVSIFVRGNPPRQMLVKPKTLHWPKKQRREVCPTCGRVK